MATRASAPSAAALALIAVSAASAEAPRVRAEFGVSGAFAGATSPEAALGFRDSYAVGAGARLMWRTDADALQFELHTTLNVLSGSLVELTAARGPTALPPLSLFDLSAVWSSDVDTVVIGGIDRASVRFTTDNLVLKVGRQAITWGSGLVFNPSDIVAPFAPNAIDTAYKPGVDMVYGQYLFDNGADIQAIFAPRAATQGGRIAFDQSTLAMRGVTSLDAFDATATLAYDRGDYLGGIGLSGPLGAASWNAEYLHWRLAGGGDRPSWLFNISNFGVLGDWNVFYYAEYFHNGFGVGADTPLDALPASLSKRIASGQVFFGGRDFLSVGGQAQVTPDLDIAPNVIFSLKDGSALASVGITYALGDNTDLEFDYFQPIGADGAEFGGRETSAGSGLFVGPARTVTLRLVTFF